MQRVNCLDSKFYSNLHKYLNDQLPNAELDFIDIIRSKEQSNLEMQIYEFTDLLRDQLEIYDSSHNTYMYIRNNLINDDVIFIFSHRQEESILEIWYHDDKQSVENLIKEYLDNSKHIIAYKYKELDANDSYLKIKLTIEINIKKTDYTLLEMGLQNYLCGRYVYNSIDKVQLTTDGVTSSVTNCYVN